jgi:hypothetical protein
VLAPFPLVPLPFLEEIRIIPAAMGLLAATLLSTALLTAALLPALARIGPFGLIRFPARG